MDHDHPIQFYQMQLLYSFEHLNEEVVPFKMLFLEAWLYHLSNMSGFKIVTFITENNFLCCLGLIQYINLKVKLWIRWILCD